MALPRLLGRRARLTLATTLGLMAAMLAATPAVADLSHSENDETWSQDTPGIYGATESEDGFGAAIAIGDFNNDLIDDLAIGSPGEAIGSTDNAGLVNVIYGTGDGLTAAGDQQFYQGLDGLAGGAEKNDLFGAALAAGDFNGDGYSDLAVSAPGETLEISGPDPDWAGAVHVIYGSASGLTTAGDEFFTQRTSGFPGASEQGDQLGRSLAAGDFNGDGVDDLAIGTPFENIDDGSNNVDAGAVYVLFGSTGSGGIGTSGAISLVDVFGQNGPEDDDLYGWALVAGDFRNDGYDDLAVGAPGEDNGSSNSTGIVTVWNNTSGTLFSANAVVTLGNYNLAGAEEDDDLFGFSLAVGDFDNNGRDDLIVGSPGEDIGSTDSAGTINVIYGGLGGLIVDGNRQFHLDSPGIVGTADKDERLGESVAAGDFDGDGIDDLVMAQRNGLDAYVVYGKQSVGLTPERNHFVNNGGGVVAVGFLNRDNTKDLAVGHGGLIDFNVGVDLTDRLDGVGPGDVLVRYAEFTPQCSGIAATVDLSRGDVPTEGDDVIVGTDGPDIIDALGGNDIVCGGDGNDVINGGSGNDRILGGPGDDTLNGDTGNDTLFGIAGANIISGGDGDDVLRGGDDADQIFGGSGDDDIEARNGDDKLVGGPGNDDLDGGAGEDIIRGNGGADTIVGGPQADSIDGGGSADDIEGNGGPDIIKGGGGKDSIRGGSGGDTLRGNAGADIIRGGKGGDTIRGGPGVDDCKGGPGVDDVAGC